MKPLTVTTGLVINAGIPVLKLEDTGLITGVDYYIVENTDDVIIYNNKYTPDISIVNRLHMSSGDSITVLETKNWDTHVSVSYLEGVPGITIHNKTSRHPSIILEAGFEGYIDIPAELILTVNAIPEGISAYDFNEADTLLNKVMADLQGNARYWANSKHKELKVKWEDLKDFADSVTFGVLTTLDPCSDGEVYDLVTDTTLGERLRDIYEGRPFTPSNVKLLTESGNYEFHDHYYCASSDSIRGELEHGKD